MGTALKDRMGRHTITRGGSSQSSDPLGQYVTYTGRWHDEETDLYHYRARVQEPTLGAFLQRDPLRLQGGPNLYTFVHSNPMFWIDPLGERGMAGHPHPLDNRRVDDIAKARRDDPEGEAKRQAELEKAWQLEKSLADQAADARVRQADLEKAMLMLLEHGPDWIVAQLRRRGAPCICLRPMEPDEEISSYSNWLGADKVTLTDAFWPVLLGRCRPASYFHFRMLLASLIHELRHREIGGSGHPESPETGAPAGGSEGWSSNDLKTAGEIMRRSSGGGSR